MNRDDWPAARLAGQRIMAGFEGTVFDEDLRARIAGLNVGGLILFARNIRSPGQVAELCRAAQACARENRLPPLLIAIDQEGGRVSRLPPPFTQFPAGAPGIRSLAAAERFAAVTAAELAAAGITTDLAPVMDVAAADGNGVMDGRAFAADPERVAAMGVAVIAGLQSRGVMAVAKHFPGLGRTRLDSHVDLPELAIDTAGLESRELLPFRAAAAAGVSGIMLAHLRCPAIDPEWPASLSPAASDWLRRRWNYRGLILTDDLEMGAITRHYPIGDAARQAAFAGADILLVCRRLEEQSRAAAAVGELIASSRGERRRAELAVDRILAAKAVYLKTGPQAGGAGPEPGRGPSAGAREDVVG
jgi:beta-N-acetylhexosaminidase